MKKVKFILFVILVTVLFLTGCSSTAGKQSSSTTLQNSLLWKIHGEKPSYLFGTMHLVKSIHQALPKRVIPILRTCETFVLEADATKIDRKKLAQAILITKGQKLNELIHENSWRLLKKLFHSKIPATRLKSFRPWFISVMVAIHLANSMGYNKNIDLHLLKIAVQGKIIRKYLESSNTAFNALKNASEKNIIHELNKTLLKLEKEKNQLTTMYKLYKSENISEILRQVLQKMSSTPILKHTLFTKRNTAWIPKIKKLIQDKSCFIAVGAGHLPGKDGLIHLLKRTGYKVTPVFKQ